LLIPERLWDRTDRTENHFLIFIPSLWITANFLHFVGDSLAGFLTCNVVSFRSLVPRSATAMQRADKALNAPAE